LRRLFMSRIIKIQNMKTIILNEQQEHFLKCACNLREYILDFSISNKDFEECYGYSKKNAKESIDNLYEKLK